MLNRRSRQLALSVVALGFAASCAAPDSRRSEDVASTSEAVIEGQLTGDFPFVGQLLSATGPCAAELVTPTWILTANHCITGTTKRPTPDGITGSFLVTFDPAGFDQPTPPRKELT